ncbi:MAG: glycosyltransferase [Chloroflexi bacterium]|nr:glycosyltransferase [Chloroflexota bacterium]
MGSEPTDVFLAEPPLISVVTPSFNQASFLDRTIRSVLDQDYPQIEYFVLDGGSSDGSPEIIKSYEARLASWRSEPDGGQASAINEGWARSTGSILGWINSDDYYLPGTLAYVAAIFANRPDASLVYGRCEVVNDRGDHQGYIGHEYERLGMLHGVQAMPQPSTFVRRSLYEEVGPIDESLFYSMDFDFFLRAAARTSPVFVRRPLAAFTVHSEAKTTAGRARSRKETFEVALRHATSAERPGIRARALRAQVFHLLPGAAKHWIDARRESPSSHRH